MDKKRDLQTMYVLKVKEIRHPICNTSLGLLELKIVQDQNEYFFTLDSVPVDKATNRELIKLYGING